jgi:dephospho-CoA kinase
MLKKAFVIGVTGNTGAGKSTAAHALSSVGVRVLDADLIARELQKPGQEALEEIRATFGDAMLNENGTLNRKKLGALVFSDPPSLKKLDNIMWPRIMREIQQQIAQSSEDIIIDAALLFETGMQVICDETWLIVAPDNLRCQRIMRRDNITVRQAKARIKSQMPQDYKRTLATHILDGSKTPEDLAAQAVSLYRKATEGRA